MSNSTDRNKVIKLLKEFAQYNIFDHSRSTRLASSGGKNMQETLSDFLAIDIFPIQKSVMVFAVLVVEVVMLL